MSSVISISAQAASVPDQTSSTTSVTGQTGSTTSVTGQTGSTTSVTGQTSVDQQEESSTELGKAMPSIEGNCVQILHRN